VIGVRVSAANREVPSWDQPIVQQVDSGIIGFIARELDGVLHLLVQLKMESGNLDLLEMAPTVQCTTSNYEHENCPLFVTEMVTAKPENVVFDVMQSEEGGRFYREANRSMLLVADEGLSTDEPPHYLWASINQVKQLLQFSNLLNVEARSLLAIL
jgi:oxidase EvaA